MPVILDGKILGDTAAKTYLYSEVEPGHHQLVSKAENDSTLDVDTVAGKIYYVWQEVKMGIMYARSKLQLVDDTTGRDGVKESKLTVLKSDQADAAK
ncbi:lipoprotein [Burkholderia cepacia GG4]|uniref:Lipoprotein n=2 Tax=Burkholderiaceae TaxID=119060 RepID=A0A9W3P9H1_BURCE|nr:lipoprotein [Burkholderia cepacia GG4]